MHPENWYKEILHTMMYIVKGQYDMSIHQIHLKFNFYFLLSFD
jgi:hypothetical protein